jgi:hypothetical protein
MEALRLCLCHPCTPSDDIFINKLRHAGRRVLREIPSRGLNQGKSLCALCLLSGRDEDVSPAHLPNNLGGVSPGVRGRTHDTHSLASSLLHILLSPPLALPRRTCLDTINHASMCPTDNMPNLVVDNDNACAMETTTKINMGMRLICGWQWVVGDMPNM